MIRLALGALAVALFVPVGLGHGTPFSKPRGERAARLEDFWRPSPMKRDRDKKLREALDQLQRSLNPLSSRTMVVVPALLRQARATLWGLAQSHPMDATVWYWVGHAAQIARDEAQTLSAWLRVWTLDPDHWSGPDTAFSAGVILAKAGRYRESLRLYQRGMPRAAQLSTRGIMASNAAESAMALGELPLAEQLYRESLILRPRDNSAAWWGLMVALDRRGRTFAAEQAAREALVLDPTLSGLRGPDVFFVPPGDVHYYLALAFQVAGRARDSMREWQRFLQRQPGSPHAERARTHLLAVLAQVARYRPKAWLGRVLPAGATQDAATLLPAVRRCYTWRSHRLPLPEGPLPLVLVLRGDRIRAVEPGWAPDRIRDPSLERCVTRALQGRRLQQPGQDRVFVTFQLERAP